MNGEADGFRIVFAELLCICNYTGQVAATASSGHLPGKDFVLILIYIALDASLNHLGKHGSLGIEAGFVGLSECL